MTDHPDDDSIVLRVWDGDKDVLGPLLVKHAGAIEVMIRGAFPNLEDPEDVVAEAFRRFWESRDSFDGERSVRGYVYGIARHVALEVTACRLNWQKARELEVSVDADVVARFPGDELEDRLDELEGGRPKLLVDLREVLNELRPIRRAVIEAYSLAGDYELDAGQLGIELASEFNDGVPIPASSIRGHKKRARDEIIAEMSKRGYNLERLEMRS